MAISKGLIFEEDAKTVAFLKEQLTLMLARKDWIEKKLDASKVETITASLCDVVTQLADSRSEITVDEAKRLAGRR